MPESRFDVETANVLCNGSEAMLTILVANEKGEVLAMKKEEPGGSAIGITVLPKTSKRRTAAQRIIGVVINDNNETELLREPEPPPFRVIADEAKMEKRQRDFLANVEKLQQSSLLKAVHRGSLN